jgi:hypothetical protein
LTDDRADSVALLPKRNKESICATEEGRAPGRGIDRPSGGGPRGQQLSEKVESAAPPADRKRTPGIPQTKAYARMIQLGLRPSPSGLHSSYYRQMAERDPILALAGLRIELETWFRNVAQGFKVDTRPYDPMNRVLARLRDANAVTPDQVKLARRVLTSAIKRFTVARYQGNKRSM